MLFYYLSSLSSTSPLAPFPELNSLSLKQQLKKKKLFPTLNLLLATTFSLSLQLQKDGREGGRKEGPTFLA